MATIVNNSGKPIQLEGTVTEIETAEIPSMRLLHALGKKVEHNILIECWGGLGDVICAEPAIRFACENFTKSDISVEAWFPEVFGHLPLKALYDTKQKRAVKEDHLVLKAMYTTETLSWEFVAYAVCQRVDYCALALFRRMLPVKDKSIVLKPSAKDLSVGALAASPRKIVVHAGRTWQSRTAPKDWWDAVLAELVKYKFEPILIGSEWTDAKRGTVDVNTDGCLDFRGKLSIMETVAVVQQTKVLLTNDSSPLHMAASGDAHIGFFSTANHPDYLKHWRHGEFGWRMKNFESGGMWSIMTMYPNDPGQYELHEIDAATMRSWLPEPAEFAAWAMEKTLCD